MAFRKRSRDVKTVREKKSVYITRMIPSPAVEFLKKHFKVTINTQDRNARRSEIKKALKEAHALLCLLTDPVDEELLSNAPNLRIVANMAVGYDNIDLKAASRHGVMATNTPGVLTETTADLAWALILGVARRLTEADVFTRKKKFSGWEPMMFLGGDVHGKTLGIVGFGRIGHAVARRAAGFGMKVLYTDEIRASASIEKKLKAGYVPLGKLLRESDFVSLHVPLTKSTRHLIGTSQLKLMKKTAYLINTSRGPVINEAALVKALKGGIIAGAGLDVYENEPAMEKDLASLPNTILLPHIGSASIETRTKMALMAAENIVQALSGKKPPNLLNEVE
jgi:glyoxylate reductase